ncbi:hypothetical protein V2J09_020686 [Rumex salicifolius]
MSDQGEKTCPLCAEEMDLTDQQLKPCKCGYEICVWCWNHIMGMAEKDETEGRCPACRTPYDKEKIVGTTSNCKRLVADASMEKKKSQKAKTRTSEGRKQLSSARVVRRNLVYIVGLPLSLADEDLLWRKEYFGQYGKVSKVSMSRTSAGTVQQFANNTCSVYITYSKEEEAARCIQSIHGFTLEGNCLRACFGTTKYCHAWLRNVTCTNPDCLYLHEIGSEEDSFMKDEFISAYSRVQQITGVMNNMQRRSGDVLPPPFDDYCDNNSATTGKPVGKSTPNNLVSSATVPPITKSAGGTGALPATASWGTRASKCQSSAGSLNHDAPVTPIPFSAAVAGRGKGSVETSDVGRMNIWDDDSHPSERMNNPKIQESPKQRAASMDSRTPLEAHAAQVAKGRQSLPPLTVDNNKARNPVEQLDRSGIEDRVSATNDKNHGVLNNIDKKYTKQNSDVARPNGLSLDCFLVPGGLQTNDAKLHVHLASPVSNAAVSVDRVSASKSDIQSSADLNQLSEKEDFGQHRFSDPIASQMPLISSSNPCDVLDHLRSPSHQHSEAAAAVNHTVNLAVNKQEKDYVAKFSSDPLVANSDLVDYQVLCNSGVGNTREHPNGMHRIQVGASDSHAVKIGLNSGMDVIESSIISNILSLDLDGWDESLSSRDLVKLLGQNERQQDSFNLLSSRKAENINQSRFSFARQGESHSRFLDAEPSYTSQNYVHSVNPSLFANKEPYLDRLGNGHGILQYNSEQYDTIGSSQSVICSNKLPVSRAQISAPPGFSVHSRIPPPGFSSHSDQTFNGNHFLESMSSLRNPYEASAFASSSNVADIEFIDPAIMAVGKERPPSNVSNPTIDMRSTFSSQTSAFENDARLQLLMQKSLQPHQNHRYTDIGDNYLFNSRLVEPSQNGGLSFSQFTRQPSSVMSNNHLDTWPEGVAGNNTGMAELHRYNELNFNKLYGSYEDSQFQISQDMYNRTFGM